MYSFRRWLAIPVSVACIGAIAACGSSSSTTTKASTSAGANTISTPAAVSSVAALVPSSIKSKGTITVAADATYAPDEFIAPDGHTVIGMDPDLVRALGAVMGLKVNVVNATFDSIIPGLAAGKFDMGASSFTDTKEREKTVDFVTYANVGESFYTKAVGGTVISTIADICGKTVSVEKGTTEEMDAQTQSGKCKKEGKGGVTVLVYPDQNGANLAVASGHAQLGFADTPVAYYQVKRTGGQFKIIGAPYSPAPYGLAMPKNGFAKAVLAALQEIEKNGTYSNVLTRWGLKPIAIPASEMKINGAIS